MSSGTPPWIKLDVNSRVEAKVVRGDVMFYYRTHSERNRALLIAFVNAILRASATLARG